MSTPTRLSLLLGGDRVCWHLRCYGSSSGSGHSGHVGCIILSSVDSASSSAFMSKKKVSQVIKKKRIKKIPGLEVQMWSQSCWSWSWS